MCDHAIHTRSKRSALKPLYCLLALLCAAPVMANDMASNEASGMPALYSSIPAVDCVINPYRVVDLASPVAGVLDTVYVERSQQVSSGQVVAQLKAGVERANVELAQYRARLQSEIMLGQVNLEFDQRRKQRVDTLYDKQVMSAENIDEANREAGLSKWKLEQARELAKVRKLELQRAREQLDQKSVRAPFDGFVLDTFKYKGEYVEDQAILRLAQLDPLVVEAIVPMDHFGDVRPGMLAEIMPEVLSDERLKGQVTIVDRIGDTASNTFGVRLVMPNPDHRIPAGLKCVVKFLDQDAPLLSDNAPPAVQQAMQQPLAQASEGSAPTVVQAPTQVATQPVATVAANETAAEPIQLAALDAGTAETLIDVQGVPPVEATDEDAVTTAAERTPRGYLVLTPQPEGKQQTRELIDRLREAGVSDLQQMGRGPYNGMIALGFFSTPKFAQKRQQALQSLGFDVFIRERY